MYAAPPTPMDEEPKDERITYYLFFGTSQKGYRVPHLRYLLPSYYTDCFLLTDTSKERINSAPCYLFKHSCHVMHHHER
jgi:hypothetical protein